MKSDNKYRNRRKRAFNISNSVRIKITQLLLKCSHKFHELNPMSWYENIKEIKISMTEFGISSQNKNS